MEREAQGAAVDAQLEALKIDSENLCGDGCLVAFERESPG
jgi:hypothetical protein